MGNKCSSLKKEEVWLLLVVLGEKPFHVLTKFEIFIVLIHFPNVAYRRNVQQITEGYLFSPFLFSGYFYGNKILRLFQSFQLYI